MQNSSFAWRVIPFSAAVFSAHNPIDWYKSNQKKDYLGSESNPEIQWTKNCFFVYFIIIEVSETIISSSIDKSLITEELSLSVLENYNKSTKYQYLEEEHIYLFVVFCDCWYCFLHWWRRKAHCSSIRNHRTQRHRLERVESIDCRTSHSSCH